ncbi:MAG: hypothetical protein KGL39_58435, partial [Patescibacteria group bacterium]|nr:hypothetical protein [Patescibacteria group bacterium]
VEWLWKNGLEFQGTFYPFSREHSKTIESEAARLAEVSRGIDGFFVAGGPSPRIPNGGHAVVVNNSLKIVHDPHPSKVGIPSITDIYMIERKGG